MNKIILFLGISACCLYADLPQHAHVWHLDDESVTFSISVFNNTQSAVYIPVRWGSSTCKWITNKGDGLSHSDGYGTTDEDLILLPAQQTHTYTFTIRIPKDRIPEDWNPTRLEYSAGTFGISGTELTKPIALRSLEAIIDISPNQSSEPILNPPSD